MPKWCCAFGNEMNLTDLPALQHTPATIWVPLGYTWVTVILLLTGLHWHFGDLRKREARQHLKGKSVYLVCLIADTSVIEGSASPLRMLSCGHNGQKSQYCTKTWSTAHTGAIFQTKQLNMANLHDQIEQKWILHGELFHP